MVQKKIVVLGTGGTIAGQAQNDRDNLTYTPAQIGVAQLLEAIPSLASLDVALACEQLAQLNSKDMSFPVWVQLAQRCAHWLAQDEVQGIVVTHGTDTLEETAYFLQSVLSADKPVVLTCAMRPATSVQSDGPQNLLDAVAVASLSGARGVLAVCAGTLHGARDVQKTHPYRLNAFSSGDAGPLGYLEEGVLRQLRAWPVQPERSALTLMQQINTGTIWPRVEILLSYVGASGAMVDAAQTGADKLHGLVLAGTGNGNLHQEMDAAIGRAQAAGVKVVRATRCPEGRVLVKPGDPLADSQGLSPVKARVALMLDLLGARLLGGQNPG